MNGRHYKASLVLLIFVGMGHPNSMLVDRITLVVSLTKSLVVTQRCPLLSSLCLALVVTIA